MGRTRTCFLCGFNRFGAHTGIRLQPLILCVMIVQRQVSPGPVQSAARTWWCRYESQGLDLPVPSRRRGAGVLIMESSGELIRRFVPPARGPPPANAKAYFRFGLCGPTEAIPNWPSRHQNPPERRLTAVTSVSLSESAGFVATTHAIFLSVLYA